MQALPILNPNPIRIRNLRESSRSRITNRSRNERGGARSCEPSLSPGVSKRTPTRIHNHILIHNRRVTVSSYLVKEGDTIELTPKAKEMALVLEGVKSTERDVPDYVIADHGKMTAKFLRTPKLSDVPYAVQMQPHLIVEFYSR